MWRVAEGTRGRARAAVRLGGDCPRSRWSYFHRPARPLRSHAGDLRSPRFPRGVGSFADHARRVRHPDRGRRRTAAGGYGEPETRDRRHRDSLQLHQDTEQEQDTAIPAGRRGRRESVRRPADDLSLSRPAPQGHAGEHEETSRNRSGDPDLSRPAKIHGSRDADPHEEYAGRRARLLGAQPHRARLFLRAAAGAPTVQAVAHDGRVRPILPGRAVFPRRGPAGRSPAGVHADRPGDVVHHARGYLRDHRRSAGGDHEGLRSRRHPIADSSHEVRRGDESLWKRQAGPAVRHGNRGCLRGLQGNQVQRVCAKSSRKEEWSRPSTRRAWA